jgi:hypothetical protein
MFVKKSYPEENKALWFDRKIHRKIHKKAKRQTLRNGFSLLKIPDMQSRPRCQTYVANLIMFCDLIPILFHFLLKGLKKSF